MCRPNGKTTFEKQVKLVGIEKNEQIKNLQGFPKVP